MKITIKESQVSDEIQEALVDLTTNGFIKKRVLEALMPYIDKRLHAYGISLQMAWWGDDTQRRYMDKHDVVRNLEKLITESVQAQVEAMCSMLKADLEKWTPSEALLARVKKAAERAMAEAFLEKTKDIAIRFGYMKAESEFDKLVRNAIEIIPETDAVK